MVKKIKITGMMNNQSQNRKSKNHVQALPLSMAVPYKRFYTADSSRDTA